jgi:hypothetical protein
MSELDKLKALLASGEFHHATYRDHGRLFEGLHFYRKADEGFRGFVHAGIISKRYDTAADLQEAEELVRHTGVSVGAYGEG